MCTVLLTSQIAHRMFSTSACLICCSSVSNTMYFHYVILWYCKSCSEKFQNSLTLDIYAVICLKEMGLVPQWCCCLPALYAEGIFDFLNHGLPTRLYDIYIPCYNSFETYLSYLDLFIHTSWVSMKYVAVDLKYSLISTLGTINLLHLQTLVSLSSEYFASLHFLKKITLSPLYRSGKPRETQNLKTSTLNASDCLDCDTDRFGGFCLVRFLGEGCWLWFQI